MFPDINLLSDDCSVCVQACTADRYGADKYSSIWKNSYLAFYDSCRDDDDDVMGLE